MFPVAGRIIDRFGVKAGLAFGAALWSAAAMGHALVSSVVGFAAARFILGLGQATNFPACIKAVAEWLPRRQRSFAAVLLGLLGAALVYASRPQPWAPAPLEEPAQAD